MRTQFAITAWAAWAPGLTSPSQWLQWASSPGLPAGEGQPALGEMPAMLRRRLGPLGRMAATVAYHCQPSSGIPVVFASRYGDADRSLGLLRAFSVGAPVSPADFALSVHNAIGAVYSIARRDTGNFSSIAAGPASAAAAVVESAGLLQDGAPEVLVVCYDASLPGDYSAFADEAPAVYAWAWRVTAPEAGQPHLSLSCDAANDEERTPDAHDLPFGLDVFRFSLSTDRVLQRDCANMRWKWSRHG